MSTTTIRAAVVAAVATAALSFAGAAQAQHVTSNPTGDSATDAMCAGMADLINNAFVQADHATLNDDPAGAEAWHDLAIDMITRGMADGCNFSALLRGQRLGGNRAVVTTAMLAKF
jgi:hypothetical protein